MESVDKFEDGKRMWIMQPEKLIIQCHWHHRLIIYYGEIVMLKWY